MKRKTIHFILAMLFTIFAAVQYNDPDPLLWTLIYGSVAIIAAVKLYMKHVNFKPFITTIIVLLGVYALVLIPGFIEFIQKPNKEELFGSMIYNKPWIEETREFLGLLMAIASLFYLRNTSPLLK